MNTPLWAIGAIIFCSITGALAAFLIKKANVTLNIKELLRNKYLWYSMPLFAVSALSAVIGYSGGELSILYPFVSLQYVWSSLLAIKYLDEKMTWIKWTGVFLILIGVSLIGLGA